MFLTLQQRFQPVLLQRLSNPAQKALIAGGTKFAIDDEADLKDIGITAALAATPDLISKGT